MKALNMKLHYFITKTGRIAWLPSQHLTNQQSLSSHIKLPKKEKERKLSRGSLTTGQRIAKAVAQVSVGALTGPGQAAVDVHDVPENEQYSSDNEPNNFVDADEHFPKVQDIMWIRNSPPLKKSPLLSFEELDVSNNLQRVELLQK
jgi:Cu/Zn superoxide dismutase